MLDQGITSFTDALVDEDGLRAYAALADAGQLSQRVRACQIWRQSPRPAADSAAEFAVRRNLWARPRFQPDCVKIALDGVPTDSHTGAMLEPYVDTDAHGDDRARGMLMVPAANLNAAVSAFDAAGLVVKMHAAGDGAVRADWMRSRRRAPPMATVACGTTSPTIPSPLRRTCGARVRFRQRSKCRRTSGSRTLSFPMW